MVRLNWTEVMEKAVPIIEKFYRDGTPATVRAVHYALVSIEVIPNTLSGYQQLGKKIIEYRKNGKIPWSWISDDARSTFGSDYGAWSSPEAYYQKHVDNLLDDLTDYHRPMWENQPYYVEVWIEKNTLAKTFRKWLREYRVKIVPCRGYPSWTFLQSASVRMARKARQGKEIKLLYYGDFDPSGNDIDRFLIESFAFFGVDVEIIRNAVQLGQIEEFSLPSTPNTPKERAKMQRDPRWNKWEHGFTRVEVDAMFGIVPDAFKEIVVSSVEDYFDRDIYAETLELQQEHQDIILRDSIQYLEAEVEKIREEWGLDE